MDIRSGHLIIGAAGGTAGKGSETYKVSIPSAWVRELFPVDKDRPLRLSFDGQKITIAPELTAEEFVRQALAEKHRLFHLEYYDRDRLCSVIWADPAAEELRVENRTDQWVKTAFGRNEAPTWEDLEEFLESRCLPRQRSGLREYLDAIGLDEYDPFEIVKRTSGRMAEDEQWLKIEELK